MFQVQPLLDSSGSDECSGVDFFGRALPLIFLSRSSTIPSVRNDLAPLRTMPSLPDGVGIDFFDKLLLVDAKGAGPCSTLFVDRLPRCTSGALLAVVRFPIPVFLWRSSSFSSTSARRFSIFLESFLHFCVDLPDFPTILLKNFEATIRSSSPAHNCQG
jgi:hypothetical protein